MWPGASPAWRKRQPASTKPRLGVKVKPPKSSPSFSTSTLPSTTDSLFGVLDPVLLTRRQIDDGTADGVGADDGGASMVAATTFNNGMWTPPAAASVASATQAAFTATVAIASDSSSEDEAATSTALSTAAMSATLTSASASATRTATRTSLASTSSPTITSTTSSSSSTTPSPTTPPPTPPSTGGFKLVYLTPILVFIGLFLVFSVGGRMWGRYHHASRVEAARRARYDQRLSRQAKKREMQRIKTMWGYDRTPMLPAELAPGEHDLHYTDPAKRAVDGDSSFGSDSDSGGKEEVDERYPGTLKILSLALLGEGSGPELPETRGEGGRKYEERVQSNGWLAVKLRRWIGSDEVDVEETRYTVGPRAGARHALSRDRLRASAAAVEDDEKSARSLASPTSTLSVGSGEMKHKAEFASVDLTRPNPHTAYTTSPNRYNSLGHTANDDPFLTTDTHPALGWKKPLPPQPKESPFRPAILSFGLRSRSKTYDPIAPAAEQLDTPVKPTALHAAPADAGFLPKTLGLGISGVWKTITNLTHTASPAPVPTDDEESFVGRPYRAHSDMLSESDTPYSSHERYADTVTPTKQPLARAGTVLQVKATANQPWAASPARKITAAAWNEALLASPPNKHTSYQHMPAARPSFERERHSLAPRKSLLLHQAVAEATAEAEHKLACASSPAFTDYSELVACYSTPSDAAPHGSIRVLSPPVPESVETVQSAGARQKLQRAKTTKIAYADNKESMQRSKTSSTTACAPQKPPSSSTVDTHTRETQPYTPTAPLRLAKPLSTSDSPAIPLRASSSSPTKPSPATFSTLPPALRIASPDSHQLQHLPLMHHHPHYPGPSLPKRAKAVSNRSNPDEDAPAPAPARNAAAKAYNRNTALQTVDAIVFNSYAQHR
ncbi:conserved hypothetical protein [Sporisorium reilianum SRZ2]|uniref:Uncharacterized protein n=1 Tax=Sporisorium reilianum (strain SRZ2) TaxID=999809 RepID=E6ZMN6_SPORE|nr:conserved hypothetical protein [Sporisorium reilianum SRZ2]